VSQIGEKRRLVEHRKYILRRNSEFIETYSGNSKNGCEMERRILTQDAQNY
jgi:hypothetical protein